MATLWLVRHGQTEWNLEGRYQGQADVPLNAAGLLQAQTLAAELSGQPFDAIYSSDLQRARVTAEIIGWSLNLPVHTDVRLREINQGQWEGKIYRDLQNCYSEEMLARRKNPYGFRPPDGETAGEVLLRVIKVADEIAAAYPNGRIVIVSHALALAALFCKAKGLPLLEVYDHLPHNAHPKIVQWPPEAASQETPPSESVSG
ncbi:MAG TPA: histidine phosphatase family protein [Longilinea sp.]|nr:histidine phosphatase family protein [Longilinea sp.]